MTEPNDYKAAIARKGLDATGFTEDHAKAAYRRVGSHGLMVVEYKVAEVTNDDSGQRKVKLQLTHVEPVPAEQEEVVRNFQRALHLSHPAQEGQDVLQGTGDGHTSIEDAAAALGAHVETNEAGDPAGVWDGNTEGPLDASEGPSDGDDGLDGSEGPWPGDEPADGTTGGSVHAVDFSGGK